jgi:stage II sporulation protein GA (sporulation sigma-E factor processing peptidase)
VNFVVYIDAFFIVNFCMNLVVLSILKKFSKQKSTTIKMCLASFLGAFGVCITVVFPKLHILLRFILMYLLISSGMICIAFPRCGIVKLVKLNIQLYIVSFFTGGMFHFLYYNADLNAFLNDIQQNTLYNAVNIRFMVIAVIILLLLIKIFIESYFEMRQNCKTIFPVELCYKGKTVKGNGLLDTGNRLTDPISYKPITIVEYELIKSLFSQEIQDYIKKFPMSVQSESLPIVIKVIPYHSVGNNSGILPAISFDWMKIRMNQKKIQNQEVIIAISPDALSTQGDYQIILHEKCI